MSRSKPTATVSPTPAPDPTGLAEPQMGVNPLDGMFQRSPLAMWVVSRDGLILDGNPASETLYGAPLTVMQALPVLPIHIQNDGGEILDFTTHALQRGTQQGVANLHRADGRTLDVSFTISASGLTVTAASQEAADPAPTDPLLVTLADITDEKCLACRIKESRDKFRQAVDDNTELMCRFTQSGDLTFVNRSLARLMGREPRDMLNLPFSTLVPSDERPGLRRFLDGFSPAQPVRDHRLKVLGPHGRVLHMWWRVRAVFTRTGGVEVFSASGRDMTAQVEAEMRADNRDRLLAAVLEQAPAGMMLWEADGTLARHNRAALNLLEIDSHSLTESTTLPGLMQDLDIEKRISSAFGSAVELQLTSGRWVHVDHSPISDGGTLSIFSDITASKHEALELRKAKEQAETASHAKSLFLHNMSHELRTPLNAIIGFGEIIDQAIVNPTIAPVYRAYGRDIVSSATHLLDIINDILDISRIETGNYVLKSELVDINALIEECLLLVRGRAEENQITVTCCTGPMRTPIRCHVDRRAIKQILINLLSNAVKFTPPKGQVRIHLEQADNGTVFIDVEDTGIGILAEDRDRIFEPFVQAEREKHRYHEGTGLGLPLSRHLAELHGGTVRLISPPVRDHAMAQGSRFRLSIPLRTSAF